MFLYDGPKARYGHVIATHETFAFMMGGQTSDKPIKDLWRFDFENVSPKGSDLHGVVAEKLTD